MSEDLYSDRVASPEKMEDERNERDHKNDVNQPSRNVKRSPADQPNSQQNEENDNE